MELRKSWQKPIYIARKITNPSDEYGNEIVTYEKPIKYYFNVQPVSAKVDILEFGEKASMMQRAVIPIRYKNYFKENDLAYLDGASPNGEESFGDNANYRLYPPRKQNRVIIIYFKRLSGK